MGCSRKWASEFEKDRDNLRERVKGIKLFEDLIQEYAELNKEVQSLSGLVSLDRYEDKSILRKIAKLWDNAESMNQMALEEETKALLRERREAQKRMIDLTHKMREISKKFNEAVGDTGNTGIRDLI